MSGRNSHGLIVRGMRVTLPFDCLLICCKPDLFTFLEIFELKVFPFGLWWEHFCAPSVPQESIFLLYQWSYKHTGRDIYFQLSVWWRWSGPNCCILWGRQVASGSYEIKDEGNSSRLRPQAQQILDSAAAGSGLRQDSIADSCRNKIRPVTSAVHPWMCATGMLQKLRGVVQLQVSHTIWNIWLAP